MSEYYDGTKLLSMKDRNGETPEIFIVESNRSDGKTTFFNRMVTNRFIKKGAKFGLIYRFDYELGDIPDKFFKDLHENFFPEHQMTCKTAARGKYYNLYLNDEHCGYGLALNNADSIKKYSHMFSDCDSLLMDEFQSETNHYCDDEITKFRSVHTSIARGHGKQVRYVPVYMLSNQITLLNPYYTKLHISDMLREDTKFLRGDGFVMERHFNASVAEQQKETGFNRAFADDNYIDYSGENVYLNDNKAFISEVEGKNRYVCTIRYMGNEYAIREYAELGIMYCDDHADSTFPLKISITTEDHNINFVMLKRNDFFLSQMRYLWEHGSFRFKNLQCKEAILNALKY